MSKVLIHSLVFSPDGVSTAYLMTETALELKRLGHTVTVLTTTPHYNVMPDAMNGYSMRKHWLGLLFYSDSHGLPVWHVKLPKKGNRLWMRAFDYIRFHIISLLVGLLKIEAQDVVIATSPPLTIALVSWLLGAWWKAPSLYKVAELYPDLAIRQGVVNNKMVIACLNWLERFVYEKNTVIVPIAEQFRRVIKERGVLDCKICMIPDFVDINLYAPQDRRNNFSKQNGLLEKFVVLYAGNIGLVQDWDSVLFAANSLTTLPICFVIIGDGSKREWLVREVERLKLKNVLLLGYQPKEFMPEINAASDISIIPMTMAGSKDGVPSKIYTIMACGKPVVAQVDADSELRSIIQRSACGRIVPIGDGKALVDALHKAFSERELLPQEGLRGCAFVRSNYSKEAIAHKYHEVIMKYQPANKKYEP